LAYYDFENIYTNAQWQKKQTWIRNYLKECRPDVIAFQEVFSPDSLKQLLQTQGYDYFAVVDQPEIVEDYICKSPVVAIASRFNIVDVSDVVVDHEMAEQMGLKNDFSASRKILRATIDLPHIGLCDCYVVHFKSKRPSIEHLTNKELNGEQNIVETLKSQVAGGVASNIQRASEAALLQVSMISRRQTTGLPMMLMGDFNNALDDGILTHLIVDKLRFTSQIDSDLYLQKYCLKDSWQLFTELFSEKAGHRKASHYYGVKGSVLDYILLSNEFDANYSASIFEVSAHDTYDQHLVNSVYERDSDSTDHGIVMITLSLRD
jgi:endonuclease/exonuclease/phosphatase family metal-dependent hydrolase